MSNSVSERRSLPLGLMQSVSCLILCFLLAGRISAQAVEPAKRMLVLLPNQGIHPSDLEISRGIQSALDSDPSRTIGVFFEHIEPDVMAQPTRRQAEIEWVREKYGLDGIDLMVVGSSVLIPTAMDLRARIWPGIPVIIHGVDKAMIAEQGLGPNVYGIERFPEVGKTLDAAIKLFPLTAHVVVVNGVSGYERLQRARLDRSLGTKNGLDLIDLTGLTKEELRVRLSSLPPQSVVIILGLSGDRNGATYIPYDAIGGLIPLTNAPVFCAARSWFGNGAVGGVLLDYKDAGRDVGELSQRILFGDADSVAAFVPTPSGLILDWRQLERWKVNSGSVPPNAEVLFREATFWERHRWKIVGVITLLFLQTFLIAGLLLNRVKRKRAEAETTRLATLVSQEHRRLEEVVSNVPGIVWESRLEKNGSERKVTFVSNQVEQILGYSVKEWLSTPQFWLAIIPDLNERDIVRRKSNLIWEKGGSGCIQFRWRAKDGRVLWVESHLASIVDEKGKSVGLRGVTLNITERKLAERELQRLTERLIGLQDEERRRIAAELHDSIGQSLVIIKNRALLTLRGDNDGESLKEHLEEIAATATAGIEEVHEIAHTLRPFELDQLGLVKAIEAMVQKLDKSSSTRISTDLDRISRSLSPAAETSIYRIVQEGLSNVVKHAEATEALVALKTRESELVITISDNGKGINRSRTNGTGGGGGGFGLAGIAERARIIGGSVVIDSEPGRGTVLTLSMNLHEVSNGSPSEHSYS